MNLKDELYFGTLKQWKQKMMKSGTYSDAVFLQQASLHLENDIMVIPAFRESTENKTPGYTVFRAKNRTVSKPLFLFYFSDFKFITLHYQSVRQVSDDNILSSLQETSVLGAVPVMQSTRLSAPHSSVPDCLYLPDGSEVSSQNVLFVDR